MTLDEIYQAALQAMQRRMNPTLDEVLARRARLTETLRLTAKRDTSRDTMLEAHLIANNRDLVRAQSRGTAS